MGTNIAGRNHAYRSLILRIHLKASPTLSTSPDTV